MNFHKVNGKEIRFLYIFMYVQKVHTTSACFQSDSRFSHFRCMYTFGLYERKTYTEHHKQCQWIYFTLDKSEEINQKCNKFFLREYIMC